MIENRVSLSSPRVVSAITEPPRAFTSCMFPIISRPHDRAAPVSRPAFASMSDRPVLILPAISLGVDAGDFLEFQGTLKGDGIVDTTAEIQKCATLKPAGDFFHSGAP